MDHYPILFFANPEHLQNTTHIVLHSAGLLLLIFGVIRTNIFSVIFGPFIMEASHLWVPFGTFDQDSIVTQINIQLLLWLALIGLLYFMLGRFNNTFDADSLNDSPVMSSRMYREIQLKVVSASKDADNKTIDAKNVIRMCSVDRELAEKILSDLETEGWFESFLDVDGELRYKLIKGFGYDVFVYPK